MVEGDVKPIRSASYTQKTQILSILNYGPHFPTQKRGANQQRASGNGLTQPISHHTSLSSSSSCTHLLRSSLPLWRKEGEIKVDAKFFLTKKVQEIFVQTFLLKPGGQANGNEQQEQQQASRPKQFGKK